VTQLAKSRDQRVQKWVQKTSRSPFLIDLMADDQRIDEVRAHTRQSKPQHLLRRRDMQALPLSSRLKHIEPPLGNRILQGS
jgi:hypothetical protein